ncbi:FecR family protein [Anseongella ginsenosidimutans]|uniref:FecR family protein n=1 Tax=Anseongella ginsenosidimutans TaxID=496056 RepID=UPI0011C87AB2|nr:FecR family protein [Anseongella ginsenosidimutans]QEC51105.1 FecR family protein [Anseongella ginsenosidimutans]
MQRGGRRGNCALVSQSGRGRKALQLSKEEENTLKQKLWSAIRLGIYGSFPPEKQTGKFRRYLRVFFWPAAAAACMLLLYLFFAPSGTDILKTLPPQDNRIVFNNTGDNILCIALPDASLVWLRPAGTLSYIDFGRQDRREVTLQGEAYFEVHSDPGKPFIVYTGEVVTRVLGTKFNIKAYDQDHTVEVEVTEGKVALSASQDLQLAANQKAVYNISERTMVKLDVPVSVPHITAEIAEEARFEFNDAPFTEVMDLLEKTYQLDIQLENDALSNCTLTASLNDETLDMKLRLICRSIGAGYRREENKIFISGDGCTAL